MSLTRRHYVLLAEALVRSRPFNPHGIELTSAYYVDQWRRDCREVATALSADNPAFNTERFMEACLGQKS